MGVLPQRVALNNPINQMGKTIDTRTLGDFGKGHDYLRKFNKRKITDRKLAESVRLSLDTSAMMNALKPDAPLKDFVNDTKIGVNKMSCLSIPNSNMRVAVERIHSPTNSNGSGSMERTVESKSNGG